MTGEKTRKREVVEARPENGKSLSKKGSLEYKMCLMGELPLEDKGNEFLKYR